MGEHASFFFFQTFELVVTHPSQAHGFQWYTSVAAGSSAGLHTGAVVAGSRSILCGALSSLFPLPASPLLSIVYKCYGCLSSGDHEGSWWSCQVLPVTDVVFILEQSANSDSSRMS